MKNQLEQLREEGRMCGSRKAGEKFWRGDDGLGDKGGLWNTGGHINPQREFKWLEEKKERSGTFLQQIYANMAGV